MALTRRIFALPTFIPLLPAVEGRLHTRRALRRQHRRHGHLDGGVDAGTARWACTGASAILFARQIKTITVLTVR